VAKVNATVFAPGTKVLFARGGEWRESLAVAAGCKGTAENPITFDAYGEGAKPRFVGSEVLANAGFTPADDNAWKYNLPNLPAGQIYVLQNHQFLGKGPATYASPTLTISSPTDPRSDGKVYTVCVRGNVIASNGGDHLVFRKPGGGRVRRPARRRRHPGLRHPHRAQHRRGGRGLRGPARRPPQHRR